MHRTDLYRNCLSSIAAKCLQSLSLSPPHHCMEEEQRQTLLLDTSSVIISTGVVDLIMLAPWLFLFMESG